MMGVRVGGGGAYVVVFVCRASPRTMTAQVPPPKGQETTVC